MAGKPLRKIKIKREPKPVEPSPEEREEAMAGLDDLLSSLDIGRAKKSELEVEVQGLQAEALTIMDRFGLVERKFRLGDRTRRAQRQQNPAADIVDYDRLWKKLGPKLKKACMTEVFDENKFAAFVASGEIDAKVLAECTTKGPDKTPFIKVYAK